MFICQVATKAIVPSPLQSKGKADVCCGPAGRRLHATLVDRVVTIGRSIVADHDNRLLLIVSEAAVVHVETGVVQ